MNRLLLLFVLVLVGCGKVAQDVSPESTEKSFKEVTLTTDLSLFSTDGWSGLMTTDNKWVVYAYAQGLEFGKGYERMGYSNAVIINQSTVSKNAYALLVVKNASAFLIVKSQMPNMSSDVNSYNM